MTSTGGIFFDREFDLLAGMNSQEEVAEKDPPRFPPERCRCCGEAWTPWALKGPDGKRRNIQCKCDNAAHQNSKAGCTR